MRLVGRRPRPVRLRPARPRPGRAVLHLSAVRRAAAAPVRRRCRSALTDRAVHGRHRRWRRRHDVVAGGPAGRRARLAARGSPSALAVPLVLVDRADPGDDHVRADQHAAGRAGPGRPADRRTAWLAAGRRRHRPGDGAQAASRASSSSTCWSPGGGGRRPWRARRRPAATLLAAAVAPRASWHFWTDALWATDRVGRTDYTGNQSLQGLLARLVAPDQPAGLLWLLLVARGRGVRPVAGRPGGPRRRRGGRR